MEQRGNWILFIILSILVFVGWNWLQNELWPPQEAKDKDKDKKAEKKEKKEKPAEKPPPPPKSWFALSIEEQIAVTKNGATIYAGLTAAPGLASLLPAALTADTIVWRDVAALKKKREAEQAALKKKRDAEEAALKKKREAERAQMDEPIPLGGQGYFLDAVLSTRGGGVRRVTLTEFYAADTLGRPTDHKLELVQDDNIVPNYLLHHFPYPEKKDVPPAPTLGDMNWTWENRDAKSREQAVFSVVVPNTKIKITKTYELKPTDYHIGLTIDIVNLDDKDGMKFRYQLMGARGLPIEGGWYTSTHRSAVIGRVDNRGGLWRELEDAPRISTRMGGDEVLQGDGFIQYGGVITQYFAALIVLDNKQPGGVAQEKILEWARPSLESTEKPGQVIAINGAEIIVKSSLKGEGIYTFHMLPRTVAFAKEKEINKDDDVVISFYEAGPRRIATWIRPGKTLHPFDEDITVRVNTRLLELAPKESVAHKYLLYHGPVKTRLLSHLRGDRAVPEELVDRYTITLHLNTLTDYRSAGPFGWISQKIFFTDLIIAFTKLMHWLLYMLHTLVPIYGVNIIMLTVIVRGIMFPISRKQAYLSIKMQEIAPEMRKLQEKYKNDPRAKTEAMMDLYRKHGVNPLGGCLPLLMQMPVFLGLYFALQESIFFRLAPFLWMPNLAAPDMFLWWGEGIPLISDPDNQGTSQMLCGIIPLGIFYLGPYLNLLPIFAVILMLAQQKIMTPPPQDDQQAMQQKMFKWMMIVFGVMFYKVASGLCLYFIASSLWGLAERRLLPKKQPGTTLATPQPASPGQGGKGQGGKGWGTKPKSPDNNDDGAFQKLKNWWSDILDKAKKK
jgi:YidC/Oxa1 family membrane protein insertase